MGFFDRIKQMFEQKQVQYIASQGYGQPIWTTQNDEQYIREAYNRIVWVYACVAMISSCASSVPWCLYRRRGGKLTEIDEHPLLELLNTKVSPYMTSKDFFDMWATYLALQGKFFAEYNNPALPTQIYPLYPHNTQPIPDRRDFVSGFEYTIGGDKKIYKAESVLWSKFFDPLDLYQGLSPIRAMARTIDSENQAVDWNKTTLQNSAVPPGAISVVNPSPELQEKLRDEWIKRYAGAKNARVPLVLNAEKASYINFGLSPIDMDFMNQRKLNRIEICSAFGVPGQVVGDPEGQTYSNYEEAMKAFWQNTVIPRYIDHMKDKLNSDLVVRYADNLYVEPDLDDITVLHESLDSIAARVALIFEKGIITRNEGREALGYDKAPDGDVYFQDIAKPAPKADNPNMADNNTDTQKKSLNLDTDEQKQMYWKAYESNREKYYGQVEKLFKSNFDDERKAVFEAVKKSPLNSIYSNIEKAVNSQSKAKREILTASYIAIIEDFGKKVYGDLSSIKAADEFDVYTKEILDYIAETSADKVVMIDDTTKNQIKELVRKNIETASIDEIAKQIDELYLQQIIPNRSTVIARTEVIGASNYGSLAAAEQATEDFGINVKKFWIYTADARVRDTHLAMGAHPAIKLDEKFKVGSSMMKYPGDPDGGAGEVINCRCTLGYKRKEDE